MQSFHPFPASPQQQRVQQTESDNPFSNPRLVQAPPPRHSSPYDLARGAYSHRSPSSHAALAHAERVAAARDGRGDDDIDSQLASLLRGGEEDLQRLSLSGQIAAAAQSASSLQSAFAAAAYDSPARNRPAAAAAHSYSASPAQPSPSGRLAFGSASGGGLAASGANEQLYYDLLKLAREGDTAAVKQLLSTHTASDALDINYADRDGDTALHRACAGGHLAMTHLLVLELRADIHRANRDGDTPLLVNARSRAPNAALLRFLVECGGDIHAKNAVRLSRAPSHALARLGPSRCRFRWDFLFRVWDSCRILLVFLLSSFFFLLLF